MTAIGALSLILHTHLPYVRLAGSWPHGEEWIHEALSESYIPLLRALYQLRAESVPYRLTLSMSPVLTEQLADPLVMAHFDAYIQMRYDALKRDILAFAPDGSAPNAHMYYLAQTYKSAMKDMRDAFNGQFKRDILGAFRQLQDEGYLEIATSAATHAYLPLLSQDSTLRGQLRAAIASYERHFGRRPSSIWLPECGYRPAYVDDDGQLRAGLESFLQDEGLSLFFAEGHSITGGRPVGVAEGDIIGPYGAIKRRYVMPPVAILPERQASTFRAYTVSESVAGAEGRASRVAVLGRNYQAGQQVWSSEWGYPGDFDYREFHKRAASSGVQYWRVTGNTIALDQKDFYHPDWAQYKVEQHAEHYAHLISDQLRDYRQQNKGAYGIVAVSYDTELFGHWWHEGVDWLVNVLRHIALNPKIDLLTAQEALQRQPERDTLHLPESSWGMGGSHFTWENPEVAWMWTPIHESEKRLQALAQRYTAPSELQRAALNQSARELCLLMSSDWQFLITTGQAREYAIERFQKHLERFQRLAETLERDESINEGELSLYAEQDKLFDEMDYRWFA